MNLEHVFIARDTLLQLEGKELMEKQLTMIGHHGSCIKSAGDLTKTLLHWKRSIFLGHSGSLPNKFIFNIDFVF